jgi:curved DNA-binding protein CbpA
MNKDYYRILGVLDDAEDIVIRAAYKALAQRYHPDKWSGSKDEANKRMSEINEAYGVLSDPIQRKQYDSTRKKSEYEEKNSEESNYENDLIKGIESDWSEVLVYFPDLKAITDRLGIISKSLEFSYKVILLNNKEFKNREKIASLVESHFLEKYFGTNKVILEFAKELIFSGDKKSAKELNRAVDLLGSEIDPKIIINKIRPQKQPSNSSPNKKNEFNQNFSHLNEYYKPNQVSARDTFQNTKSISNAMTFLKSLDMDVYRDNLSWDAKFTVTQKDKVQSLTSAELIRFASSLL